MKESRVQRKRDGGEAGIQRENGKWGGGRQVSKEHSNTGPRTDCPPDSKGPVCPAQAQKGEPLSTPL